MEQRIELGRAWPGFTARGTVVLPVPARLWPPPSAPVMLHGCRFQPKRELHVTLVGTVLGACLQAAMEDGRLDEAGIAAAFAGQSWQCARAGPCMRLERRGESAGPGATIVAASLIERIELPAMDGFHADLGRLLGASLDVPPPHVTLYTRGDDAGIGVPDEATLAALVVDFGA